MEIIFSRIFKANLNILFILLTTFITVAPSFSLEKNEEKKYQPYFKSEYLLGPGDYLKIQFEGLEFFNSIYIINQEGYLTLPEIERLNVQGKTLKEISKELNDSFSEYIYEPNINVSIYKKRPIIVTLRGAANRTGLYKLEYEEFNNDSNIKNLSYMDQYKEISKIPTNRNESFQVLPRMFDLLQKAEGVLSNADLSRIEVIRNNALSKGGGKIKTNINLLALIQEGDQNQNIVLHDGDDIFIPKTEKVLIDQILDLNRSNLYPDKMEVFINGNVFSPGRIILKQGTSLIEAIAASGGKRNLTGKIEFVRLKRNGKTEKRLISFKESALKGSYYNPILINGDMIFVRRNMVGKTANFITEYASPLVNGYGVYKIFE